MPTGSSQHNGIAVSVIMINRNGGDALARAVGTCRAAVERALTEEPGIELLIVDNGSTDHPEPLIERELKTAAFAWRIVREPQAGVNYARNAGIDQSAGGLLLFVDSDLEFDPGWLLAFIRAAASWPRVEVFAGKVRVGRLEAPAPDWLATSGPFTRGSIVVQCNLGDSIVELPLTDSIGPVGPNMGFRRSLFQRFGPFDVRFGLRPGSLVPGAETEFFDRLIRAGLTFLYVPGAVVDHPLRKSQMTRAYFKARLHGIGRATSRLRRVRGEKPKRLFGMTLYVFPHLLRAAARVASTTIVRAHPAERFHAVGDVAFHLGYLHEDLAVWRRQGADNAKAPPH